MCTAYFFRVWETKLTAEKKSEKNYYLEFVAAELKKEKKLAPHPVHLKGKK